jgi:hypothetical protein
MPKLSGYLHQPPKIHADLFSFDTSIEIRIDHCPPVEPTLPEPYPRVFLGPVAWYPSVEQLEDLYRKIEVYLARHQPARRQA